MRRVGIFGGSFNPLHAGHLRLAIEALELLGLARVEFVPCLAPPHKPGADLLPFDLRARCIEAAVAGRPGLAVNRVEGALPPPSYTFRTLEHLRAQYRRERREPGADAAASPARPVFLLGSADFLTLPHWHRGLELPLLADMAVLPRAGDEGAPGRKAPPADADGPLDDFVAAHWPEAERTDPAPPQDRAAADLPAGSTAWRLAGLSDPDSGAEPRIFRLPMPRLEVSASLVRERWLAGRSVACLVPDPVERLLDAEAATVRAAWRAAGD